MYKRRRSTRGRPRRTKRARSTRSRSKKTSRALTKKIKSVVLKTTERKYNGSIFNDDLTVPVANNVMQIHTLADVQNWSSPSASSAHQFRIGQDYYLTGFNLKWTVMNRVQSTGLSITPLWFRAIVICAKDQQGTVAPNQAQAMWRGVDDNNVSFDAIKTFNQVMWYKIDWKQYHTVYDKKWLCGGDGNGIGVRSIETYIPINKYIKCSSTGEGSLLQSRRYFMLFFAYDPRYNATGTYHFNFQWQTTFRDP